MKPVMKIDKYGNTYWYLYGKLHKANGPAVELANGIKSWNINEKNYHQ